MNDSDVIFQARGAGKVFAGERGTSGTRALLPVDFSVRQGDIVTLIGPSGCGKSTLLRLIAGLANPSEGELSWWGGGREIIGDELERIDDESSAPMKPVV